MLSAIIISPDDNFRDHTRELLQRSELIEVKTELNEIGSIKSAIIIVDGAPVKEQGFQTIEKTIALYKDSYVFVAGDQTDRDLILRCMRAGAKEFLSNPIQARELFSAVERERKVARSRPLGP